LIISIARSSRCEEVIIGVLFCDLLLLLLCFLLLVSLRSPIVYTKYKGLPTRQINWGRTTARVVAALKEVLKGLAGRQLSLSIASSCLGRRPHCLVLVDLNKVSIFNLGRLLASRILDWLEEKVHVDLLLLLPNQLEVLFILGIAALSPNERNSQQTNETKASVNGPGVPHVNDYDFFVEDLTLTLRILFLLLGFGRALLLFGEFFDGNGGEMRCETRHQLVSDPLSSVSGLLEDIVLVIDEAASQGVIRISSIQFREEWYRHLDGVYEVLYRQVLNLYEAEGRGNLCVLDGQINDK
jgi:hypothetical protein